MTELELAGKTVRVSSPDKVYFPKAGFTKLDLIQYYVTIEPQAMAAMGGRPTMMQRFPDGASGKSFYQKRVPKGAPDWLETTEVSTPNGTTSNALVIADIAHVAWAVNLGCLGFHLWPYRAANPEHSDQLRIDLDPSPGVDFAQIAKAALKVRALLDEVGLRSYPKTTGSRGLHIFAPLLPQWDSYAVRQASVALARELERRYPEELTAAWWKEERGSRVFVDYNQNAPHKTVFGAWSARARVGGQVSTPLEWDEVESVRPDDLTIATVPQRVANSGNPWQNAPNAAGSIEPLLTMYQNDLDSGMMDAPWPPVYPKQPNEPPRVAPSRAKKAE